MDAGHARLAGVIDERLLEYLRLLLLAQFEQCLLGESRTQDDHRNAADRHLLELRQHLQVILVGLLLLVHLAAGRAGYLRHPLDARLPHHRDDRLVVLQGDEHDRRLLGVLDRPPHPLQLRRFPFGLPDGDLLSLLEIEGMI